MRQKKEERAEREEEIESHLASREEVWREEREVWREEWRRKRRERREKEKS
jgi:hypothetical protein